MNTGFVHQIVDFNREILEIPQRSIDMLSVGEFDISIKCLIEEVNELSGAHTSGDLIGCIDAMVDLQYFSIGVLYKMGLTPEKILACQNAVHQANMDKKRGINHKRGDGSAADAVKPAGWVGPEERIAKILDAA